MNYPNEILCPGPGVPPGMFTNPDGSLKPDVPSGYFSDKIPGVNYGTRQPINIRQMWSYACPGGRFTDDNSRIEFCNTLTDAAGNIVTNPPPICGGTGPEVLTYNPVDAAVQDIANTIDISQFDVSDKVKQIIKVGVIVFLLIILVAVVFKFL